ncbi:hypothetical protein ACH4YO_40965 [Streptomyces noursei]|uniref:hypothetical protein n=1 Tax=Streptomyces noursei TaxID=1971 RepID=UPI0033EE0CBF
MKDGLPMSTPAPSPLLNYRLNHSLQRLLDNSVPKQDDLETLSLAIGKHQGSKADVSAWRFILAVPYGSGPGDLLADDRNYRVAISGGSEPSQGGGWRVDGFPNATMTHCIFRLDARQKATFDGSWNLTFTLADFWRNPAVGKMEILIQEDAYAPDGQQKLPPVQFAMTLQPAFGLPGGSSKADERRRADSERYGHLVTQRTGALPEAQGQPHR